LRLDRVVHAPYYALFLVGPAANAIEIFIGKRASDHAGWNGTPGGSGRTA
jgi:hypothetical protein